MDADKRFIEESGLEARIASIVAPVAADLGYDLVRVKILPDNGMTLQIMAEDANGRFSIDDCERLSREINPALDVEDPIAREYHLEVSSPGIDRPLVRPRDFSRHVGHEAKIELREMIDGRRRFRGTIVSVDANGVTLKLPDAPSEETAHPFIEFVRIGEAKLVMTDALLADARAHQELNDPKNDPLADPDVEQVEDMSAEDSEEESN